MASRPAPVAAPAALGYVDYIHEYFEPGDWATAEAVCMAESHCRANAVSAPNFNGTRDYGVFQVNSVHSAKVNGNLNALLDPETNVKVAAQIKHSSGWSAWATHSSGKYLQYMQR